MALLYGKSPLNRNAIALWLSVCVAGSTLGALLLMCRSGAAQAGPPAAPHSPRDLAAASQSIKDTENSLGTHDPGVDDPSEQPRSNRNRRDEALVRANFEKARHDAAELANLAQALQQELSASNSNVLPLDVIAKAEKIEKLAKKIKGNARGL